jgi:hypothetical protein
VQHLNLIVMFFAAMDFYNMSASIKKNNHCNLFICAQRWYILWADVIIFKFSLKYREMMENKEKEKGADESPHGFILKKNLHIGHQCACTIVSVPSMCQRLCLQLVLLSIRYCLYQILELFTCNNIVIYILYSNTLQ